MIELPWPVFWLIAAASFACGLFLAAKTAHDIHAMTPPRRPPDEPPRINSYLPEPSHFPPMPEVPPPKAYDASGELANLSEVLATIQTVINQTANNPEWRNGAVLAYNAIAASADHER